MVSSEAIDDVSAVMKTTTPEPVPRVSVLLAVYNGERFLRSAIDSVLAQTLEDFELLVMDDGSDDQTQDILASYLDPRVRVTRTGNQGRVAALNRGLAMARAELIARMDDDDVCYPERLSEQVKYLDAYSDVVVVGSRFRYVDEMGRALGESQLPLTPEDIEAQLLVDNCIAHPSVMFRKTAVLSVGGYHPVHVEDYDLWLRLSDHFKLANLPAILLDYRVHRKQFSHHLIEKQVRTSEDCRRRARKRRGLPVHQYGAVRRFLRRIAGGEATLGRAYAQRARASLLFTDYGSALRLALQSLCASPLHLPAYEVAGRALSALLTRRSTRE